MEFALAADDDETAEALAQVARYFDNGRVPASWEDIWQDQRHWYYIDPSPLTPHYRGRADQIAAIGNSIVVQVAALWITAVFGALRRRFAARAVTA